MLEKQMKLIENAGLTGLKLIIDHCKACQLHQARQRSFLFSMDDRVTGEFNHSLQMEIVHLPDGNVLHVICTGTGFQKGMFVNKMSGKAIYKVLRMCWIGFYGGAHDFINANAGSNFTADEIKKPARTMGIILEIVPTEYHNRIGKFELCNADFRTIYAKLKVDIPSLAREERL